VRGRPPRAARGAGTRGGSPRRARRAGAARERAAVGALAGTDCAAQALGDDTHVVGESHRLSDAQLAQGVGAHFLRGRIGEARHDSATPRSLWWA